MIRDVLLVVFKHSATQRQRQAAIDLVHATVVGGLPIGGDETIYVVRIPYVLARRDSTSGPLLRAMAALRRLPAVDGAVQMLLSEEKDYDRRKISEVKAQVDLPPVEAAAALEGLVVEADSSNES